MVAIFTGAGAGFTRGSGNLLGGAGQLGGALLGRGGEGVSVNAATGGLLISHQDEFLVGLGPDVAISRTYNSQADAGDGDNGDNWQQSTTRKVIGYNAGVSVQRLGADGALITYNWVSGDLYRTKDGSGAFDTLEYGSGTDRWTWTDGDSQSKEVYGAAQASGEYRITSAGDIDGNALSFTYVAGTDKLDKVTTADGSWTQYAWSGNSVTSVVTGYTDLGTSTAKTLTRVLYTYDGSGRLQTVTTDLTPGDSSVADGLKYVTTYTYDGASNRVASIAQSDGSLLTITYDGSNRVQTLTQTVASGVTRVTTLAYGTGYTTVTGPDSQVTRLDYDGSNRLTKITAPAAYSGATAQIVQFAYDADGNLDTVTDGNGKITSYDYDANGNATLITDATGNTVTRTYDAQNRLITELTTGADRDGASVAHYQQYVYDAEGHLRFAVNAAGQTTEYQYSTDGKLIRTIQYAEQRMTPPGAAAISEATATAWASAIVDRSSVRVIDNSYDARGNLTQSKAYGIADTSGNPLTTEGTTTSSFIYDQAGNLIERYRPGENHETFLYDGMGRLYSSTDKNGGTTTIVFSDASTTTTVTTSLALTTTSVYNKAGELVSYIESGASTTTGTAYSYYDAAGRLRKVVDASGREAYFYYDKAGRKVAEVNQLGELTEYRYDAAGRVAATIAYSTALAGTPLTNMQNVAYSGDLSTMLPTASGSDVWSWTIYDDAGRAIQVIDNLGSTVTNEYDTEGKLAKTYAYFTKLSAGTLSTFKTTLPTSLQLPATNAKDTFSRVFYNKAGQQIASLDGEGYLTESIRDGAGLVTQTTRYAAATVAGNRAAGSLALLKSGITASTADRVTYSVYDGQGLIRYSVDAKGGVTGFTYDDAGRLTKTTAYATSATLTDFTYDAVKAAVATSAADRTSWIVYDAAGRAAYTVDAEGGVTAFAYNAAGQVVKAIAYDNLYGSTVDLVSLTSWATNTTQANDTANRLTRTWYNARGEAVYSLDPENYATGYAYDAEGRVLSTTRYGGSGVAVSDSTTISQLATLLSGIAAANLITVSQTYDNAGRVLTTTTPLDDTNSTVTRNTYNALGQLTDVAVSDNDAAYKVTTHYTYDGAGQVLTVTYANGTSDAATVSYAYDGLGNRITVTDARGNAVNYTYDKLGEVLTATNALSGVTTYVYDAFGNVVKVTTPGGESTYSYYDRLNRLVTVRDAENFVTKTKYNRFGEVVDIRRYANAFTGTPQVGINPTGDPDAPYGGPGPAVVAAYAHAADLQNDADAAAAALAAEQAALLAAKGTPLVFMQNKLAELQAQRAVVQAQYDSASFLDKLLVYGPQLIAIDADISRVNNNITRLNNGQNLDSWGSDLYNSGFNVPALQSQYNSAQAAADQALADAQALEQAEIDGDYGPYAGSAFVYDRLGRVVQKTDAEGYGETSAYNAFGQLVSFKRYGAGVGAGGFDDTKFEYDERGLLIKTIDAQNFSESYSYDAFGRRIGFYGKSWTGNTTAPDPSLKIVYDYYKSGLLKSETSAVRASTVAGGDGGAIKTSYIYDKRGNLITKTESENGVTKRTTTYAYDKLDRRTSTSGSSFTAYTINASTKALSTAASTPTEQVAYDANGNVTRTIDMAGTVTIFFYDQLGRKTAEVVRSDPANNKGVLTTYGYDADGNTTNIKVYETLVSITASANGGPSSSAPSAPSGNKRETTFEYDGLGQLNKSMVVLPSGYKIGVWNGSSWTNTTIATLDTLYQYDYLGNVVKVTDPNGNATFSYYDKLGRKTAQLDAEGYLSTWTYNSEGNVLTERRYNTKFTGTATTASPPSVSTNANDRLTTYTYDKVGNRLSEARSSVVVHNGSGGTSTVTSTVQYAYNGLGQVITKTEATGDVFTYAYDAAGRLTQETRPTFTSNAAASVTPQVNYFYNSLGDLVRTVQAGNADAAARVTTYTYDVNGRMATMTDAEGEVRTYQYNASGNLVLEYYNRTVIAVGGSTSGVWEGIGYRYDALGRSIGQAFYTAGTGASPAAWTFQSGNDWTTLEYNSFGDVIRTSVNGAVMQENSYDLAGRMWATNGGDGIWKYYGYDKAGNQTVAITSAGANLTGKTFAQALGLISGTDVNGTYTVYDKRNLATSVVEEGRQLVASGTSTLTTSRAYNAFGEVASETNAANVTVTYTYNTMGRRIRSESPAVSITMEDGTSRWVKPAEDYYYDKSGRLVATRDANGTYAAGGTNAATATSKAANTGNLTMLTLLAGTGYGGSEALVATQTFADGGITETYYDILGNARKSRVLVSGTGSAPTTDVWRTTEQTFDKLGRLLTAKRPGTTTTTYLYDDYTYDELGQLIEHGNNVMSTVNAGRYLDGNTEITVYDTQGRITGSRAYGAFITENAYAWQSGTSAWRQTTTYTDNTTSTGKSIVEDSDLYGRTLSRTDLGGHVAAYTYDSAGRLTTVATTVGANSASYKYDYYNTGQLKSSVTEANVWTAYYYASAQGYYTPYSTVTTTQQTATYTYDAVGNRLTEVGSTVVGGSAVKTFKNQTAVYNALGRISSITAASTDASPAASTVFTYDANGNIRSKAETFQLVTDTGAPDPTVLTQSNWFRYDSMNRVVLNNGTLSGTQIIRRPNTSPIYGGAAYNHAPQSESILYDKAGQRTSVAVTNAYYDTYGASVTGVEELREIYTYDPAGRLIRSDQSTGTLVSAPTQAQIDAPAAAPTTGTRRSTYSYDAMGRQLGQVDYKVDGTTAVYSRTISYNTRGQIYTDNSYTVKSDGKTYTSNLTNTSYGAGATYAFGAVVTASTYNYVTGGSAKTASTTNTFQWWDSALQATTAYDSDISSSSNTVYNTSYTYNPLGQLTSAYIGDGMPRTVTFSLDEAGQIIRRDETKPSNAPSTQTGSPHEIWYRFGEREWGYVGNNASLDVSMASSIDARQVAITTPGTFRGGYTYGLPTVDFTRGIDNLNSYNQGSRAAPYTVKQGDDLRAIAQRLYGDANLWYKIAEANGLSAGAGLVEGQQLTLPAGIERNTYNASTYNPYDPAEAIGDLSPTAPKPPKKAKCGFLGQLLLAVISIAVTAVLTPVIGPVGAAVVGNITSQAVGVATGIQEKFSFKSLAMTAITAGITQGLNGFSPLGEAASGSLKAIGNAAIRGAVSSAIGQGIGVATGLQDKFSWAGVAAAGVSAGVGEWAGGGLPALEKDASLGNIARHLGTGTASLIASAATRSAIEGSSFGDNIKAGLPDVIGQVIGRALGGAAIGEDQPRRNQQGGSGANAHTPGSAGVSSGGSEIQAAQNQYRVNSTPVADSVGAAPLDLGPNFFIGEDGHLHHRSLLDRALEYDPEAMLRYHEAEKLHEEGKKAYVEIMAGMGASSQAQAGAAPIDPIKYPDFAGIPGGLGTSTDFTQWIVEYGLNQEKSPTQMAGYLHEGGFSVGGDPDKYAAGLIASGSFFQLQAAVIPFLESASQGNIDQKFFGDTLTKVKGYVDGINSVADRNAAMVVVAGVGVGAAVGGGGALVVAAAPTVLATSQSAWTFGLTNAAQISTGTGIVGEIITGVPIAVPAAAGTGVALLNAADRMPALSRAEQLALNATNGRAFEDAGIRGILSHVGMDKNTIAVTRNGVTTILDAAGRPAGLVEFKDVANLSSSPQLRAQLAEALATRQPYNLVVSPGNKTISAPLLRQINAVTNEVGGGVYRYDPATDILIPWAK